MTVDPTVVPVVDEGLGNSAYLVDLGDGRALAVDPCRDLRTLHAEAVRRKWRIAVAADTHLHADFLSGARQLAAAAGATLIASAAGGREFPHTALSDGDEVDLGGLTLRALGTPGHTPEHLSYVVLDGGRPIGVFTGGSLLVGGVARTDLVSPDRAEELARAQYLSVHRLLALGDDITVWPTHGAGSFCSSPARVDRISTIGRERRSNPLLAAPDEDAFVQQLLGSLGSFPSYFLRLAEVNRRGPAVISREPRLAPLDVDAVRSLCADGAEIVDVRPIRRFGGGHIPGALSIPLGTRFATWLGWLVDPDTPIVVVRDPDQDPADIVWPALKIGVERLAGELLGGMTAWEAAQRPIGRIDVVTPGEVRAPVLDVRQDSEFDAGHLPGAAHVELGALRASRADLPAPGPLTVMCGHGERAMMAASLLERTGRYDLAVLEGGVDDWARATAGPVERAG